MPLTPWCCCGSFELLYLSKRDACEGIALCWRGTCALVEHTELDLDSLVVEAATTPGREPLAFCEPTLPSEAARAAVLPYATGSVALLARLRCAGGRELVVGTVHIHWDWHRPDLQTLQGAITASALLRQARAAGGPPVPALLCGDFNTRPQAALYRLLSCGTLQPHELAVLRPEPGSTRNSNKQPAAAAAAPAGARDGLVDRAWAGFALPDGCAFRSAYAEVLGKEPRLTNFTPYFTGCLDYIFMSQDECENLRLRSVLRLPTRNDFHEMRLSGCPNARCSSDHLPLLAAFEWR